MGLASLSKLEGGGSLRGVAGAADAAAAAVEDEASDARVLLLPRRAAAAEAAAFFPDPACALLAEEVGAALPEDCTFHSSNVVWEYLHVFPHLHDPCFRN